MRYCLNAIGLGKHDEALQTVGFVRNMKAGTSRFLPLCSLHPLLFSAAGRWTFEDTHESGQGTFS